MTDAVEIMTSRTIPWSSEIPNQMGWMGGGHLKTIMMEVKAAMTAHRRN